MIGFLLLQNLSRAGPAKDAFVLEKSTWSALFTTQIPHSKEQQVATADTR